MCIQVAQYFINTCDRMTCQHSPINICRATQVFVLYKGNGNIGAELA